MTHRLGVDVGGTFTDLSLYDVSTGRLEFAKTASTPEQSKGVVRGTRELIERLGIAPSEIDFLIHGTTVATNTLLQRSGARTALVVTKGFRDVLHIGRQERPHLYDWRMQRPEPLVPRHLRFEIGERILYTGEVLTAIDDGDLEALVERVKAAGADAIAVCLLHSYANPEHEKTVGAALSAAMPDSVVVLSHEVLPEFKEYERMSTTAINAYVAPVMRRYLRRLEHGISALGLSSDVHIMQSNGGHYNRPIGRHRKAGPHHPFRTRRGSHRQRRRWPTGPARRPEHHLRRHGRDQLRRVPLAIRERCDGHQRERDRPPSHQGADGGHTHPRCRRREHRVDRPRRRV